MHWFQSITWLDWPTRLVILLFTFTGSKRKYLEQQQQLQFQRVLSDSPKHPIDPNKRIKAISKCKMNWKLTSFAPFCRVSLGANYIFYPFLMGQFRGKLHFYPFLLGQIRGKLQFLPPFLLSKLRSKLYIFTPFLLGQFRSKLKRWQVILKGCVSRY